MGGDVIILSPAFLQEYTNQVDENCWKGLDTTYDKLGSKENSTVFPFSAYFAILNYLYRFF
ncbi:hypothetical protein OfM1_21630 [Lactovum odontotermitis]